MLVRAYEDVMSVDPRSIEAYMKVSTCCLLLFSFITLEPRIE